MSVQKFEGSSRGKLNTAWVLQETVRGYGNDGEWAEGAKMTGLGGLVDRSSVGLSTSPSPSLEYTTAYSDSVCKDQDDLCSNVSPCCHPES